MIPSLDSSFDAPTLAQALAAKDAGIGFWWGYLATTQRQGAFNLAAPWSESAFANVLEAGLGCGAMVSGWDDPVALRQLARAWGIPLLALDDEDGIRPLTDPDWRPAFLAASGAGHYGLRGRLTLPAPFLIAAEYPAGGCPGATWPTSPAPGVPHGWQCQGTHTELGLSVDRAALDDWFARPAPAPALIDPRRTTMLQLVMTRPAAAVEDTWVDVFTIEPATNVLRHWALDPATRTVTVEPEQLPGVWASLIDAPGFGWSADGSALVVLGEGTNNTPWVVEWSASAGWSDHAL